MHEAQLRAWMRREFPSLHDVDDLVQDAMTRVWQARDTAGIDSPRAYLFTAARHLAIDRLRRQQVVAFGSVDDGAGIDSVSDGASPAETAAHHQELELLTQAIQALPERCRQVLTLRKVYGLTQKQIAEKLGIAEHTVEAQVANGMRKCARFFSRLGLP